MKFTTITLSVLSLISFSSSYGQFCPKPSGSNGPLVAFSGPGFCSQCLGINPAIDNRDYLESTKKPAFGEVYDSEIVGVYPKDDLLLARALAGVQNKGLIFKNYGEAGIKAVYRRLWNPEEIAQLHASADRAKAAGTISLENYVSLINIQSGDLRPSAGVWLNRKTGANLYPFAGSGDSKFMTAEAKAFVPEDEGTADPDNKIAAENPISELIRFLEKNATLSPNADPADFTKTLNALQALQVPPSPKL